MTTENENDEAMKASRIMFKMAGVKLRRLESNLGPPILDFSTYFDSMNDDQEVEIKDRDEKEIEKYRDLLIKEASFDPKTSLFSKRLDYLSWDDYFTAVAFLTSKRSKDPRTQVGACIVDVNKCIVGIGYNGFPRGCSDDYLPWGRTGDSSLQQKYAYVVHAEVNAILNKGSKDVKGSTLYVALFPCNECAKVIIQAGITEVVYLSDVVRGFFLLSQESCMMCLKSLLFVCFSYVL
jgi:dCMP deaminase